MRPTSELALSNLTWSLAPQNPELKGNEIHVWLVRGDDANLCIECCEDFLSAEERDRAARFKFPRDRRRYLVAHAALRSVLAVYLKVSPSDLHFSLGANGKPKIAAASAASKLEFNLSHSHEVALIAVTKVGEIGVDVEWVNEDFAFEEVAQRFFTAREVAALTALPRHLQRRAFYQCWTSKEAYLKAKGTGLSGELDEVEIVLGRDEDVHIKGMIANWFLMELSAIKGYEAALVLEGHNARLNYYLWKPQVAPSPHSHS